MKFFYRGSVYSLKGYIEVYMFFFFFFTLVSCILVLWPFYLHTLYSIFHIWWWCIFFFTYLYMCCLFSIFIHMFLYVCNLNFCSHMMPWWVLFMCFRKTCCESLFCHELFSCKVFQEFVVRIDLFCNITSGYEFSDLKLLSWLFVLLWFCHRLPKGEIVRNIFYVIG